MQSTEPKKLCLGIARVPARYAGIVMPFILSMLMTCIVSLICSLKSNGLSKDLLHIWSSAWGLSWLVAFPTLLLILPFVRKLTAFIVEPAK